MNKLLYAALAGGFLLAGCGGADESAEAEADQAALDAGTTAGEGALDAGTTSADMSPTLEGSGDMSSAAGAGAATGAMDGGSAGEDGAPPGSQGEGGPGDALE